MKRSTRIALVSSIVVVVLVYGTILLLQNSDSATINAARRVDAFITSHCANTNRVPSLGALQARFPDIGKAVGWRFFTDSRTYLKMQYPVKWWNGNAIGVRQLSEFTATPYAYVVEYRCGPRK